jgi:nucleoside-diphosphate-sugar epimerase
MNNQTPKTKNMKIVIIGGTGLIGTKLVNNLQQQGHEVVAASPSKGINSVTGEGLATALTGAQVVVDVTNAPFRGILKNITKMIMTKVSTTPRITQPTKSFCGSKK